MAHSSKSQKPRKPHKDFPLFAHLNGQWAKKVNQKMYFFGTWENPDAALQRWVDEKDNILAGRVHRGKTDPVGETLGYLVNKFLTSKKSLLASGELSNRTYLDYYSTCNELVAEFGERLKLTALRPEDFEKLRAKWAAKWGAVKLMNEIVRTRTLINYGVENGIIVKPILYGQAFKLPSKKKRRLERAEKGKRKFEADELVRMIDKASQPLKAMLLLGINAAMGNSDIGNMEMRHLDLKGGWINFPRPKTGIDRRIPLWPETVAALEEWFQQRPEPKDEKHARRVFVTKFGGAWFKENIDNPIAKACRKLLDDLGIEGNKNFYALRHTFETVGGESRDQIAVDMLMGHADESMSDHYREGISDERRLAVTNHIRNWLNAAREEAKKKTA